MRKVFRAAGLAIVLAAGLSMSVPMARANADQVAAEDPPGATCYHFPLITVCCDSTCHIQS